jgi:hypothetical protein
MPAREVVYDPNTNKYYNVEKGKKPDPNTDKKFGNHTDAYNNDGNVNYPVNGVREELVRHS